MNEISFLTLETVIWTDNLKSASVMDGLWDEVSTLWVKTILLWSQKNIIINGWQIW